VAANRSRFPSPPSAQLSLKEILPPVSIDVPSVAAARQYTTQLRRLWPADGAVTLAEAHRSLDTAPLMDVVLAAMDVATAPDAQFHTLPSLGVLMPNLRGRVWRELLDGRLTATGIKDDPVAGKRVAVPTDRLRLLEPNWARSELHLDGRAVVYAVEIERVPPTVPKTPPRKAIPGAELRRLVEQLAIEYTDDKPPPSVDKLFGLGSERASGYWVPRNSFREAWKTHAPQWARDRGRPRRGKSRE
jgi:hypothetical protein